MKILKALGILCLCLYVHGCGYTEEPVTPGTTEPSPITSTSIDPLQEEGLMDKLNEALFSDTNTNGRTMKSMAGEVDLSSANKVVDSRKGTTRYTFLLKNDGKPVTRNLVLRQSADGHLSIYTITYNWDTKWVIANPELSASLQNFTGVASFETLDGYEFYRIYMKEGRGTLYSPKNPVDANGRVQCSELGGETDSGSSGAPDDGWTDTGSGDFGEYPDVELGGGEPGQVIVIYLDPTEPERDKTGETLARTACETPEYPDQQVCAGDDALATNCESEPIGTEEDYRSPYEVMADNWEEDICLQDDFAANDCLMEIWNLMNENNVGYETLTRFKGEQPGAKLCIGLEAITNTKVNGRTYHYSGKDSVMVVLNSNNFERSKLRHAKTLLHELIHAELVSMVMEAGGYDEFQEYASDYAGEDDFLIIWNYIDNYGNYIPDSIPGWQHQYMAEYYIEYMSQGLKKLHPYLSSQRFIEHCEEGVYYLEGYGETYSWNWDDFFIALAWEGLMSISSDPNYKVAAWEALSDKEKAKIIQYQRHNLESNDCTL